jgi:hypothetical protein
MRMANMARPAHSFVTARLHPHYLTPHYSAKRAQCNPPTHGHSAPQPTTGSRPNWPALQLAPTSTGGHKSAAARAAGHSPRKEQWLPPARQPRCRAKQSVAPLRCLPKEWAAKSPARSNMYKHAPSAGAPSNRRRVRRHGCGRTSAAAHQLACAAAVPHRPGAQPTPGTTARVTFDPQQPAHPGPRQDRGASKRRTGVTPGKGSAGTPRKTASK